MDSDPRRNPGREAIQSWLQIRIAEYLQLDADDVDASLPFSYYGLDSVASLGISGELEVWLDRKLPQTLTWDYPNIELLSAFLAQA
jgi:acyl carrier protein